MESKRYSKILDEMRENSISSQKRGIHFIIASILIWTIILITLGEGAFKAADANTFRIDEPNVTIEGQGSDKTIIDTESYAVSGQAG